MVLSYHREPVVELLGALPLISTVVLLLPAFNAYDAVEEYDADVAFCAQLAVPKNPTALLMELVYDDADTFP